MEEINEPQYVLWRWKLDYWVNLDWSTLVKQPRVYHIFFSQKTIFKWTLEVIISCNFRVFNIIANITKKRLWVPLWKQTEQEKVIESKTKHWIWNNGEEKSGRYFLRCIAFLAVLKHPHIVVFFYNKSYTLGRLAFNFFGQWGRRPATFFASFLDPVNTYRFCLVLCLKLSVTQRGYSEI